MRLEVDFSPLPSVWSWMEHEWDDDSLHCASFLQVPKASSLLIPWTRKYGRRIGGNVWRKDVERMRKSERGSKRILIEDGAEMGNTNADDVLNEESANEDEVESAFALPVHHRAQRKRRPWCAFPKLCARVRNLLWSLFVEACYIPAYRWEWGNFSKWTYEKHGQRLKRPANKKVDAAEMKRKERREKRRRLSSLGGTHQGCQRVAINCSGVKFETQLRTLCQFPETLLGNPERRYRYWNPKNFEYFFDRHAECFESIIHYYQTRGSSLERPNNVNLSDFVEELKFFDIRDHRINEFIEEDAGTNEDVFQDLPANLLKRKLWLLTEYPESSLHARLFSYVSITSVLVSTVSYCLGTMGLFRVELSRHEEIIDLTDPLFFTETVCAIFFVFELIIRIFACPNRKFFLKSFSNLVDFTSTLPYALEIILFASIKSRADEGLLGHSFHHHISFTPNSILERFHRVAKLIRVFRILKLSRYSMGLRILGQTFRTSLRELALLAFFLMVGVILFSSALYFGEGYFNPNTSFTSIPTTFFWAVSTMTTTGYDRNDQLPTTVVGKIIGSLCAIAGVLTLSLPVPVVVANFTYFYNQSKALKAQKKTKRNYVRACPHLPTCQENHRDFYAHKTQRPL